MEKDLNLFFERNKGIREFVLVEEKEIRLGTIEVVQEIGQDQFFQRLFIKELLKITLDNIIGLVIVEEFL